MSAPTSIDHDEHREQLEALGRDLARLLAHRWLDRHADDQAAPPAAAPPDDAAEGGTSSTKATRPR